MMSAQWKRHGLGIAAITCMRPASAANASRPWTGMCDAPNNTTRRGSADTGFAFAAMAFMNARCTSGRAEARSSSSSSASNACHSPACQRWSSGIGCGAAVDVDEHRAAPLPRSEPVDAMHLILIVEVGESMRELQASIERAIGEESRHRLEAGRSMQTASRRISLHTSASRSSSDRGSMRSPSI